MLVLRQQPDALFGIGFATGVPQQSICIAAWHSFASELAQIPKHKDATRDLPVGIIVCMKWDETLIAILYTMRSTELL